MTVRYADDEPGMIPVFGVKWEFTPDDPPWTRVYACAFCHNEGRFRGSCPHADPDRTVPLGLVWCSQRWALGERAWHEHDLAYRGAEARIEAMFAALPPRGEADSHSELYR